MSAPLVTDRTVKKVVPVVRMKPILEAQEKHGPIFRRELFDHAYTVYQSINDQDPENGRQSALLRTEVTLLDIYGNEVKGPILRAGYEYFIDGERLVNKRVWMYRDLQKLGTGYGEGKKDLLPYGFGIRHLPVKSPDEPVHSEFEDITTQWRSEWDGSEVRQHIVAFLTENGGHSARRVDQIACFGLGRLAHENYRCRRISYVQHLAACTVRDIFAQQQGGNVPGVYAQDPAYDPFDTAYLSEQFGITVLQDPEGFKALNGNTFVITLAPNVPVRQIAIDMTHEFDGPAGFLCGAIQSDGMEDDGKDTRKGGEGEVVVLYTDPLSPSLWRYKNKSIWTEVDDRETLKCLRHMGVYLKRREDTDITT